MFKKLFPALVVAQVVALLMAFASPGVFAAETTHQSSNQVITGTLSVSGNTTVGGNLTVTGTTSSTGNMTGTFTNTGLKVLDTGANHTTTIKQNSDEAANRILNVPALGADAEVVVTVGNQTIAGTKTFSTAPTITGGLTAANIQTGSAKRQSIRVPLAPNTGTAANSTVYSGSIWFGRAGTVTRITYGTEVDPVSGTNTIKVLKASSAGNTMLNAASVSLNGATANVGQNATLTGTGADLGLTATQSVYCEYSAGTQGAAAKNVAVTIEFEPTDF